MRIITFVLVRDNLAHRRNSRRKVIGMGANLVKQDNQISNRGTTTKPWNHMRAWR